MGDSALAKKLLVKPGQRIIMLNAPEGYLEELGTLPDGVNVALKPDGTFDLVHLFVRNPEELARLAPTALQAVKREGVLWVSYPKQTSKVKTDMNRDRGWDPLTHAGFRPVTQISINETWSALRFRPTELVKS